jgi:hypothetical protein
MTIGWIEPRVRPAKREPSLYAIATAFVRLLWPATLLLAVYVFSFYWLEAAVGYSNGAANPQADPAWWMSYGHLTFGLGFFLVMLTNRAHGPAMALGQVAIAWAVIVGLLTFAGALYGFREVRAELPPTQVLSALVVALLFAHTAGVFLFHWQRSVPWWKAPVAASIATPWVFVLTFYPLAYWGADVPWGAWLKDHGLALTLIGATLLILYALLRRRIRPGPGLGGA